MLSWDELASLIPAVKLAVQAKHFACPEWGGQPERGWQLEVLKDGSVIGVEDIDLYPYYIFGRDLNVADYAVEHLSASRVHAVLVHHYSGSKYLIDLGTKFGTMVNGTRIAQFEPSQLQVGDRIRFAQSSREHVLVFEAQVPVPDTLTDTGTSVVSSRRSPSVASTSQAIATHTNMISRISRSASSNEAVCYHLALKHRLSVNPVDRHKLPITRSRSVAVQQILEYRRQILAIPDAAGRLAEMGQLAQAHSDCEVSWNVGGYIRAVDNNTIHENFAAAALALLPGELSAPVETPMAVHLILRHA